MPASIPNYRRIPDVTNLLPDTGDLPEPHTPVPFSGPWYRERVQLSPDYPVCTARTTLRPLRASDSDDLLAYRSLREAVRYVPFEPMDRASIERKLSSEWIRSTITAPGEGLTLGVELRETSHVIGDVTLHFASAEHRSGEIGWIFHPDYSGHGYATEAAHAILHLGFDQLGLHRISARIDSRNDPSVRLAERLGMRREAYLRQNEWFKGEWSDEIGVALLDDEWVAQHPEGVANCS